MKRRVTFIQPANAPFEPEQAALTSKSLTVNSLEALREDRVTFELKDLPPYLHRVFHNSQALHLRWASEQAYDTVAPFTSRLPPGLHVHFTPAQKAKTITTGELCSKLHVAFGGSSDGSTGVDCGTIEESFITPPLEDTKSPTPAALHYHTQLPSLDHFVAFLQERICGDVKTANHKCYDHASSLLGADTIDLDYDSTTQTVTFSTIWAKAPAGGWKEEINGPFSSSDKVEFGLLSVDQAPDPEDLKMGGLLAVIGTDKKLKPTMFHFPSRHQPLPESSSYTVSFSNPTGLHPTLSITIPQSSLTRPPAPEHQECSLNTYLTLPSSVFGDQYQLATTDPLFLESHNLAGLRAHAGETDLEAPDWAVQRWGSTWLFELAAPSGETLDQAANWTATIPLHLRYLRPSESGYRTAQVPWPVVFWACNSDDETPMGMNPFDRTTLGWDSLFNPHTLFYQLRPDAERLVEEIDVPVLQDKNGQGLFKTRNIEIATSAVIGFGFLWVLWRLVVVAWSSGIRANKPTKDEQHKKKE